MSEQRDSAAVYPIRAVEKATGLSARQIRYYEKKGLISPSRTAGNQRLYSPKDIDRLNQISRFLGEGLPFEAVRATIDRKPSARERERSFPESEAAPRLASENTSDHDQWFKQSPLPSSVFPVKNQARLVELLMRRKKKDGEEDEE